MKTKAMATLAALALLCTGPTFGQEESPRPEWDQKKALEKVKRAVECEKSGEKPWEKIAWTTDPEEATRRAGKERKPILVFLFKKITQEWDGPEMRGRC